MSYIQLALLCLKIFQYFITKAQENKIINAERARAFIENSERQNAELQIVLAARKKVRDDIAADPSSVHKPDPFERKD